MLVVRQAQLNALRVPARLRFEAEMLAHLGRCFPVDEAILGRPGLLAVVRLGQREAIVHSFSLAREVRCFVSLQMVLGSGFARDPLLPWAGRILAEGRGRPGTIDRLVAEATDYLELANGEEGHYALRAVLRAATFGFDELTDPRIGADDTTLALLRRIWPQKLRLTRPEQRAGFLRAAAAAAAADGLDTPGPAQLYTVFMFLLGAGFSTDPALPWARAALMARPDASAIERARALHEAGLAAVTRLRALLPAGVA